MAASDDNLRALVQGFHGGRDYADRIARELFAELLTARAELAELRAHLAALREELAAAVALVAVLVDFDEGWRDNPDRSKAVADAQDELARRQP